MTGTARGGRSDLPAADEEVAYTSSPRQRRELALPSAPTHIQVVPSSYRALTSTLLAFFFQKSLKTRERQKR